MSQTIEINSDKYQEQWVVAVPESKAAAFVEFIRKKTKRPFSVDYRVIGPSSVLKEESEDWFYIPEAISKEDLGKWIKAFEADF